MLNPLFPRLGQRVEHLAALGVVGTVEAFTDGDVIVRWPVSISAFDFPGLPVDSADPYLRRHSIGALEPEGPPALRTPEAIQTWLDT